VSRSLDQGNSAADSDLDAMMAPNSPEFAKFIADDAAKWAEATAALGVKVRVERTGHCGVTRAEHTNRLFGPMLAAPGIGPGGN
jgi:hypothetical protein